MTVINRTHKIRLDPTFKQENYFRKACGVARFTWNWALAKWEEKYKAGEKTNALALKKEFNALKTEQFPWVYEVTKYASQQPFIHLQRGFQGFFAKRTKYPKFKKKGIHDSFYIGGDQVQINEKHVKIPNLGWVRLMEFLRFEGKITGVTISRSANYWFISVGVETSLLPMRCENQASIGVDLGVKTLATLSNGKTFPSNNPLKKKLKRLRRLQRQLSKSTKGSNNRIKVKQRIAKLHYKVACSRNDAIHKLTTTLTKSYRNIVIEDLDISEMVKNKTLARSILDGGFYEFRRQLTYKASLRGNKIFIADKWYASSKKCSSCGNHKEALSLSEREYKCRKCELHIDRDLNAAKCLVQLLNTVSSTEIDACRQDGSVIMLKALLQPAWLKQELSPV
jgi:putative transposase